MIHTLTLVLADQLFENHPAFGDYSEPESQNEFVMVESLSECRRLPYHKFKLAYLLSAMREYGDYLRTKNHTVHYYNLEQKYDFDTALSELIDKGGFDQVQVCEVNNTYFRTYLERICHELKIKLTWLDNPMFLTSRSEFSDYLATKKPKRLQMGDFYIWQRKRLRILIDKEQVPLTGSWSLDGENRKKLPTKLSLPDNSKTYDSKHYNDVTIVINTYFADNPGQLMERSWLPLNHEQAGEHLERFLDERFGLFGDYEDALSSRDHLLFHSALSSCLNYGLLTPAQILHAVDGKTNGLVFGARSPEPGEVLNSIEGFVRQIIGWREWVKGMYDNYYNSDSLKSNFFGSTKPLPEWFYSYDLPESVLQNTPLVDVLGHVDQFAYAHHIERLMILSNWMTLNEYDPRECYEWFSSQFVDAFEWVMVPNVMGMGLFADGGIYATKPYISGGNYIKKMSDYPNSAVWERTWTDLFWSFLEKHRTYFEKQPRLGMLLKSRQKREL